MLLFAGVIFVASSFSIDGPEELIPHFDKIVHLTIYGVLSFLLYRAFRGTFPKASFLGIALWTFLLTVAYGASDEFHQSFVPYRDSDIFDLLSDSLGAILVLSLLFARERSEVP